MISLKKAIFFAVPRIYKAFCAKGMLKHSLIKSFNGLEVFV